MVATLRSSRYDHFEWHLRGIFRGMSNDYEKKEGWDEGDGTRREERSRKKGRGERVTVLQLVQLS